MRIAYRLAMSLAVLIGLVLTGQPAQADDPSLSIENITFTPGGGMVTQTLTYRNLPANSTIRYSPTRDFGDATISGPAGTTCSYDVLESVCGEVTGSGVIEVTYGGHGLNWDAYAYAGAEQSTVTASVDGTGLTATGTVTVTPAADLTVNANEMISGVWIVVYSHGPSVSSAETLRITGLTSLAIVQDPAPCELEAFDVVCYMHQLSPTTDANQCNTASRWLTCYSFRLKMDVEQAPRLTFTVDGPLPDPDSSNNTKTLFDVNQPPPPPAAGGGAAQGGQPAAGGRGSTPAAPPLLASMSSAASSSPSRVPVLANAAPTTWAATPTVATGASDPASGSGPVMLVVAIGLLAGAGVGGTGILVARRRLRIRPAGSPDDNEPDIEA